MGRMLQHRCSYTLIQNLIPTLYKCSRLCVCSISFLLWWNISVATHIRGGELTYRSIAGVSLTYEFTLTMYHDIQSPVRSGDGIIDFGDGRVVQIDTVATSFEDGLFIGHKEELELFKVKVQHTYSSPGIYAVTYTEPNRNDEILNINLGNSIFVGFLIKSLVVVDPAIGINHSPQFNTFPVDYGFVGKSFSHNPWCRDPDGDSLAYRLITPRTGGDTVVTNYLSPNNWEFYRAPLEWGLANEAGDGSASYSINPFTGTLIWDAPGNLLRNTVGDFSEYTLAFLVEEWRIVEGSWKRIGFVIRDFLVIVTAQDINRPDFQLPDDIVIDDLQSIDEIITFSDPDGNPIKVEFLGEIFNLSNNPMLVTPVPGDFTSGPLSFRFQWSPLAAHARARPYFVHLKITDQPDDPSQFPAVTYKTWILSFSEFPNNGFPDVITGLVGQSGELAFMLFPNPTTGPLAWHLEANTGNGSLTIYNYLGQRTLYLDLTSNGVRETDISIFPSGLYIAEFNTGSKIFRQRIIKE